MKPYRKNVGVVIFNSFGEVLVGERIGLDGSWQFPQGGIDENEDTKSAAYRELYEEVGIKDVCRSNSKMVSIILGSSG